MESRLHAREPVELMVRLVQEGRVIATARAIDMSSEGLGIEHPDVVLNSGQIVDVDFSKAGHPRGVSCCVPSMVAHTSPKSVGLMLAYDPRLRLLLREYRSRSAAVND